jgi:hypothetical protein
LGLIRHVGALEGVPPDFKRDVIALAGIFNTYDQLTPGLKRRRGKAWVGECPRSRVCGNTLQRGDFALSLN